MTMFKKMLAGGVAVAALAAAAPASAQYGYQYNPYANQYANPYANQYANPYANQYANPYSNRYAANNYATQAATQRCTAAVQQRLHSRTGLTGVVAALLGAPQTTGRVVAITQVNPRRGTVRVNGLASSGRMAGYGAYGVGAYGAAGYAYQPDLSFRCDVDYRGYVRNVRINRR
ncbi:MAG: hypothetical protein H0W39_03725 [Sphingomonas sp.]|nr:hypothetical protein [Sphingomonas sp.]